MQFKLSLLHVAFLTCAVNVGLAYEWTYDLDAPNGPARWAEFEPKCGQKAQSPINIISDLAEEFSPELPVLRLANNDYYQFINTGDGVQIRVLNSTWTFSEGGVNGRYIFDHFDLHWGGKCGEGSAHQIDGKSFALESHAVHYKDDFSSLQEAIKSEQKQAVFIAVILVDMKTVDPPSEYDELADQLYQIPYKGDQAIVSVGEAQYRTPPKRTSYFMYDGSLAEPGCDEVVVWCIFNQPLTISEEKLNLFRQLKSTAAGETPEKLQTRTFRPVQELNGRKVYKTPGLKPVEPSPCSG